jgi:hypothetical protein
VNGENLLNKELHDLYSSPSTRVVRKIRFPMIFHNENMFIGIE